MSPEPARWGRVDLRWIDADDSDAVAAASDLFDHDARPDATTQFLAQPNHHLCIAYEEGQPAGFVSGVTMTHPDKGGEMFLYELGVQEEFQGRGIGRALARALVERAREGGCYGMWALTDANNDAAIATYRSAGADEVSDEIMLTWSFGAPNGH